MNEEQSKQTDPDFISLGLRLRDTIRTSHINVHEMVEFELILRHIREIVINFWVKGSTSRAKPNGYDGAVIIWDVLDTPPAGPDCLNCQAARPMPCTSPESERGKTD